MDKTFNDTTNLQDVKRSAKKIFGQDKQGKVDFIPKHKKYLTLVNQETGEIEGHFPLKSKGLGTGWIAVYQDPALWLAQQRLTGEQYSVLFYLFNKLDFDNYLRISQKNISETLGLKQQNVSRSLKVLEALDIILEGPRAGLNKTYRLNPYVAHKGKDVDKTTIDFSSERAKRRPSEDDMSEE